MTNHIEKNTTPKQYSMSGINLSFKEVRMLADNVAKNKSLIHLHISRKGITDQGGVELAKMLIDNKTLTKLELEGNLLENLSAAEFGKALRVNKTLRYLDLSNNNLTN